MNQSRPDAVSVRAARPGDRDAVLSLVASAFGTDEGPRVARLVSALEDSGKVRAGLVAELDGQVVGHVQLNHSWVDAREALVDVLVLSPLSVDPAHQRNGIGTVLVEAAVSAAEDLGCPALFLEGSPSYYGARGFVRGSAHGFTRPSPRIPDPAFQVVVLPLHEPWMTGPLVYCEPFWAYDCVGLRDPELGEVEALLG
ncbi:GNAT family N-acetyltransferase [Nocardioides sp. MAHUQ-72]|uniref:GNAT family N-acetyltransferase n=1 Tax=unclassified Nocardioides TaxID=2615069 RepID=UPI0036197102